MDDGRALQPPSLGAQRDPGCGPYPWAHLQGGVGAASFVLHGTINSVHFEGMAECVNCGVVCYLKPLDTASC